ncbi:uncharacterized protein LOC110771809 [Prunus avium]|uniref:Uncharacterized protein LOC110771809 n=1 Tax=Prunus avium TaxID=42229 RepID=A0A6P5TYH9_PRUAV|nr:uncharacterized protein LOC110771809 [Prunus avium]
MRCKKHLCDLTSAVGVCSSCLRERLTAIIEAQTKAQAQLSRLHSRNSAPPDEPKRKSDPNPPPLIFPRSVSPYVSRRKSDDSAWHHNHRPDHQNHHHQQQQHRIRFYSTPQVGPTYNSATSTTIEGSCRKTKTKFSLLSSLFRSRSDKFWSDPSSSTLQPKSSSSASSPSWFSAIFSGKRRNRSKQLYADESNNTGGQRPRGLSPDITPDPFEDCERSRSGSGDSSGATPEWKQTPALAPSSTRRTRVGQGKNNVSGLAFCLSPLVRASPNRNWGQKGLPPEFAGEIRVAAAFCKNRSRKLVDFGRANPNR